MNSILDTNITMFQNYNTVTNGKQVNLLKYLRSDKYYNAQLEAAAMIDDEKAYKAAKSKLVCILPSCTDCTDRSNTAAYKHTGLVQIDLDAKDNPHVTDWNELKSQISQSPNIAYCGLSVSGKGLWGIIPIKHTSKHLEHFKYLERYFAAHGLTIDTACKNVQRLRGYAYDPNAYFNHSAKVLKSVYAMVPEKRKTYKHNIDNHSKVASLIQQINQRGIDIAPDYNSYLELAFAFATEFGSSGEDLFLDVCSKHHSFNEAQAIAKYKNALKTNTGLVTIGSFYHMCKLQGLNIKNDNPFSNDYQTKKFYTTEVTTEITTEKQLKNQFTVEKQSITTVKPEYAILQKSDISSNYIYKKDLEELQLKVPYLIKDTAYAQWVLEGITRAINANVPRLKSSSEMKELFNSIESN